MLSRNVMIDGLVYRSHEIRAIVHQVGASTSVVVASYGDEHMAERDFSREFDDTFTVTDAYSWIGTLDEFAEYDDPRDDLIDDLAGMLTDEQAATVPSAYALWELDVEYQVGKRVRYGTGLYKCLQAHTSQEGWEPTNAPSIWATIIASEDPDAPDEWVQPDSTNAYMTGDVVTHGGKTWRSLIDNNVWEPGAVGSEDLWEELVGETGETGETGESGPEQEPEPSEPEMPAEWVQPDSTNPYMTGDRVTFNGAVYESLIDNNVFSPADYPQGWEEIQ